MSTNHFLGLPKIIWGIKIAQLVLSVIVLALSAYCVYVAAFSAHALAIFTAVFSIIILVYYLVAVHAAHKLYNWVALLVLEILAVIFWLSTWATLAALYADLVAEANSVYYYDYTYYARSLSERATSDDNVLDAYNGVFIAALTFSVINFILYCVTLVFMSLAAHRLRTTGRPMTHVESGVQPQLQHEPKTGAAAAPVQPNDAAPEQTPVSHVQSTTSTPSQPPMAGV